MVEIHKSSNIPFDPSQCFISTITFCVHNSLFHCHAWVINPIKSSPRLIVYLFGFEMYFVWLKYYSLAWMQYHIGRSLVGSLVACETVTTIFCAQKEMQPSLEKWVMQLIHLFRAHFNSWIQFIVIVRAKCEYCSLYFSPSMFCYDNL